MVAKGKIGRLLGTLLVGGMSLLPMNSKADRVRVYSNSGSVGIGGSEMFLQHLDGGLVGGDGGDISWYNHEWLAGPSDSNTWLSAYSDQINILDSTSGEELYLDNRPVDTNLHANFPLVLDTQDLNSGNPGGPITSSNNYVTFTLQQGPDVGREFYHWNMTLTNGAVFADETTFKSGVWNLTNNATTNLPLYNLNNVSGIYGYLNVLPSSKLNTNQHQLVVNSSHGTPTPQGTNSYDYGTEINASVNGNNITNGLERYVSSGWNLSGGLSGSGSGTNTTFNMTNNATLDWNWKTQYLFNATSGVGGSISEGVTNAWLDSGTTNRLTANPSEGYHFTQWLPSGDTNISKDFVLTDAMTNVAANFAINQYNVGLTSTYTNWFGTNTIGNPSANPNPVSHGSASTITIDKYVTDTNSPGRRLRFNGWRSD